MRCMFLFVLDRPLLQAAKRATQEYRKTWRPEQKPEPGQAGTGESGQQPSADAPISEDLGANACRPVVTVFITLCHTLLTFLTRLAGLQCMTLCKHISMLLGGVQVARQPLPWILGWLKLPLPALSC